VCPECPKTFPQPSNLKAHLKTHVKRTLRAYWICQFGNCQKAFTAKGNLKVCACCPRPGLSSPCLLH
jgi:uncharacterized Zn-finger protein